MINSFSLLKTPYDPSKADTYTKMSTPSLKSLNNQQGLHLAKQIVAVRNAKTVSEWQNLQSTVPGACLVHSIRDIHQDKGISAVFKEPAQSLLSQWDVISTSLIDLSRIEAFPQRSMSDGCLDRKTGCYGDISLILESPAQNIFGTHPEDVYFDNHVGVLLSDDGNRHHSQHTDTSKLADHLKSGVGFHNNHVDGGFSRFVSPAQLLSETKTLNEVLIVGRNDVNLHEGEMKTAGIKVLGILSARRKKFSDPDKELHAQREHEGAIAKLQKANPGLNVYEL